MKVLYSWAQASPGDWLEVDARQFRMLPNRGIPARGARGNADNAPGWLSNLMVQGVMFNGLDHVAVEHLTIDGEDAVRVYAWNDDPDDYPPGQRVARVWLFRTLAPDPTFGSGDRERLLNSIRNEPGITERRRAEVLAWHNDPAHFPLNTRQSQVVYAEGDRYDKLLQGLPQNTILRRWDEFMAPDPAITRHGIWVPDEHWERQVEARTPTGWMHWNEHLPESECEWESGEIRHNKQMRELRAPRQVLREQRAQGRYSLAAHTITYYQRDTDRAVGFGTVTHENAFELSTASSATESSTVDSSANRYWYFATPENEPNSVDWPSGVFHAQFNCTTVSAGVVYGANTLGGGTTAMGSRAASDLSSEIAHIGITSGNGDFDDFSGTGLKLSTSNTVDMVAGSASDRFCVGLWVDGDSHGDAITLTLNTTDSYADGPWTSGTAIDGAVAGEVTLAATLVPNIPITAALRRFPAWA